MLVLLFMWANQLCILTIFFWMLSMSHSVSAKNKTFQFHIDVEQYELNNGLRVLLNPDKKIQIASYVLGIATGSRHEREGITGISHMFEHLMFKGTSKYPDVNKIFSDKGIVGVNAFTTPDYTAYHATFLKDQLEFILSVESDRMVNLTFSQEDLDKERAAVQEERLLRTDNNPQGLLWENMFDLLFTKHPYRWSVLGYSKDIAAYTVKDLKEWYKTYYSPNNAVLVISGNVSKSKAKKLIEKYFGSWSAKQIPPETKVIEPEQLKTRSRVVNMEVQAPLAYMFYKIPPIGEYDFVALEALGTIFGGGESSILHQKMVREKKLLNSVSAGVFSMKEYGYFIIIYSLPDLSKEQIVKKLILEELKRIIAKGLNDKSLEKVKNVKMNERIFSLKKSMSRALTILDYEIQTHDWKKMYKDLDILDKISSELIQEAGTKYLKPEQLSYVILKSDKTKKLIQ